MNETIFKHETKHNIYGDTGHDFDQDHKYDHKNACNSDSEDNKQPKLARATRGERRKN